MRSWCSCTSVLAADSAPQIAPSRLSGIRNSSSPLFNGNVKGVFNIWSNIDRITKTWQRCVTQSADAQKSRNDTEKEKPDHPNLIWSTTQAHAVIPETRELLIRLNRQRENKPKETDDALVWLVPFLPSYLPSSLPQLQNSLQDFCSTSPLTGLHNLQASLILSACQKPSYYL